MLSSWYQRFLIILGDFNARSKNLTSTYGLHQLILGLPYLFSNSPLCIDPIFTDQSNLAVDSAVHLSLYPNCRHQITYCKLKILTEYSPPFEWQV